MIQLRLWFGQSLCPTDVISHDLDHQKETIERFYMIFSCLLLYLNNKKKKLLFLIKQQRKCVTAKKSQAYICRRLYYTYHSSFLGPTWTFDLSSFKLVAFLCLFIVFHIIDVFNSIHFNKHSNCLSIFVYF